MLRRAILTILLGALASAGCGSAPTGPKLERVTGKVTFKGEPVKEGDITIVPVGEGTSGGGKIVDGHFSLEVSAGKKIVKIEALRDVPGKFREDNPGEKVQVREQFIPEQFNAKSKLELDVTADGPNDKVFDLSS
jgi:hypothetical protein